MKTEEQTLSDNERIAELLEMLAQTQRLRQSERVLKSVKMRVSTWCLQ